MIRHIFRLIWNRKRRNFLLISEIFFSFIVLFAVATLAIFSMMKYLEPRGFSEKNVWVLRTGWSGLDDVLTETEVRVTLAQLQQEMEAYPEIKNVCWTAFNHPYSHSSYGTELEVDGRKIQVDFYPTDDNFAKVMDIQVIEGRWFSREDDASSRIPIVLDRQLKEQLFGAEPAVGKTHQKKDEEYIVVGVIDRYRYHGEFDDQRGGFFRRSVVSDTTVDAPDVALLSVQPGIGVQFEEQLLKRLAAVAPGWNMRIQTMENLRATYLKEYLMGTATLVIIAGFLVFNVALGLFGVLWYSINRRRAEVGLRRALGAHAGHISRQILGESLALATFAIILGAFIAVQVPIIGLWGSIGTGVYLVAMLVAALLIYLLVTVCALYPSRLAARIEPATALHSD